jgi:hypothetical protein
MTDDLYGTRCVLGPDGDADGEPPNALSTLHRKSKPARTSLTSIRKDPSMLQSHVIDIDGDFVGAAVRLENGYRFVAINMKLGDLDGSIWPTLADVQRLARRIYLGGRVQVARA